MKITLNTEISGTITDQQVNAIVKQKLLAMLGFSNEQSVYIKDGNIMESIEEWFGAHSSFTNSIVRKASPLDEAIMSVLNELPKI